MEAARSSRVDRLKENDGGGVNLLLLFSNILSTVQHDGKITVATAREAIKLSHNNQFGMMRQTFRGYEGDGVENYLLAALELLESQERLVREGDVWFPGPKLVYDAPMRILMNANRHWTTVKLSSKPAQKITFSGEVVAIRSDIHALVRLLEPDAPGLREITQEGKEEIKESLAEYGLMPGYPILKDDTRRILNGRHRMAVECELKAEGLWNDDWPATWPVQVIHVADDLEAIRIALAGNRSTPFTEADFDRLDKLGLGSTKTERQRRLIELALLENANRSNRTIAKLMPGKCSDHTVASVRRRLEASAQIAHFEFGGGTDSTGRGIVTGKPATPRLHEDESRIVARMKEGLRRGERWKDICIATGFPAHGGDSRARSLRAEAEKKIAVEDATQALATPTQPAFSTVTQVVPEEEPKERITESAQVAPVGMPNHVTEKFADPFTVLFEQKWQEFLGWPEEVRRRFRDRLCPRHTTN